MTAVMCQVLPQFYKKVCEKALFISVSVEDCRSYFLISPLKTCRYHIVLISSSTEDLLQKLEEIFPIYIRQSLVYIH